MILVTGGTGLVGIHLLVELCNNNQAPIVAIYRTAKSTSKASHLFLKHASQKNWDKIKWIEADITDIPSLEHVFETNTITEVYHCAALVSFKRSAFESLKKINIEGTANIINFCIDYKVSKFCYVSSIATLNLKTGQTVIDETSSWNSELDNSGYAISKFGGEMEVWRGVEEGLDAIIVHPGVVIGEVFRSGGSAAIFQNLKKGMPFYTTGKSGYVTAFDVAAGIVKLMTSDIVNERFVLVSQNIAHQKVTQVITAAYGKKAPKVSVPNFFVTLFARIEYVLEYLFGYEPKVAVDMVDSLFSTTPYSSEKLKNRLNFKFELVLPVIKDVAKSIKETNF